MAELDLQDGIGLNVIFFEYEDSWLIMYKVFCH